MTAEAVDKETKPRKERSAGRPGPLAPFLRGETNVNADSIFRQAESNSEESTGTAKRVPSWRSRQRSYGQGYCSQRRPSKQKRRSHKATAKPRRFRRSNSRPVNGRNDATPYKTPLIPTSTCFRCGSNVVFTNENRCENCFAEDQSVWHGRSLNVILVLGSHN